MCVRLFSQVNFCLSWSDTAQHYLRAAELAPEDYEIVFNAANALRQSGQNSEAEMFYRHAVTLRPQVGEQK
jgi:protein O-mannosyl-transferase